MGRLSSRADWAWRRVRAGLTGTGPCHAGSSFQGRLNPLDGEKAERLDAGVQLGGPILSPSSNMRVSPPPQFSAAASGGTSVQPPPGHLHHTRPLAGLHVPCPELGANTAQHGADVSAAAGVRTKRRRLGAILPQRPRGAAPARWPRRRRQVGCCGGSRREARRQNGGSGKPRGRRAGAVT